MIINIIPIIKKIIRFFEKNYNFKFNNKETKIKNIIKTTDFNEFKKFEETDNFKERTKYGKFFSIGKKDQWKNQMNLNQINKVEKRFEKTMKMFNYKLSVEI